MKNILHRFDAVQKTGKVFSRADSNHAPDPHGSRVEPARAHDSLGKRERAEELSVFFDDYVHNKADTSVF